MQFVFFLFWKLTYLILRYVCDDESDKETPSEDESGPQAFHYVNNLNNMNTSTPYSKNEPDSYSSIKEEDSSTR